MKENNNASKFVFVLRKPFRELPTLCSICNNLIKDEHIHFKMELRDITEKGNCFVYFSLSCYYVDDILFVINRDIICPSIPNSLLMVNNIGRCMKEDGLFPFFSTDASGSKLEISLYQDFPDIPHIELPKALTHFSCFLPSLLEMEFVIQNKFVGFESLSYVANSILENGNVFISKDELGKLKFNVFLCHPSRPSLQIFIKVTDDSFENNYLKVTKLNFASNFHSRVIMKMTDYSFIITLYKSRFVSERATIQRQFDILDRITP